MDSVTVALIQTDCSIGEPDKNLCRFLDKFDAAFRLGAQLVVFPEAAVTGYCFDSLEQAKPFAEPIPGPTTERLAAKCRSTAAYAVVGMLEIDAGQVYNSAALVGPAGYIGKYRKIHLPYLGIDRYLAPGNEPPAVFDTPIGRIGMLICYDLRFPEATRDLALQGVDLVALPTNWPTGAESNANILVPARALENHIYVLACDRVGEERGYKFIGMSGVVDPDGKWEARTETATEQILFATIRPERARLKHRVRIPGEWEIHLTNDRRPELYGRLTEPRT